MIPKNMELDTKITCLGVIIPKLCVFLISAILGGGHIEYGPKKMPSRFFPPGILIDLVNRPPKDNNYASFKTIPIFSRSNSIFMRLLTVMSVQDYHGHQCAGCSLPGPDSK